jgi:hypothetical protein
VKSDELAVATHTQPAPQEAATAGGADPVTSRHWWVNHGQTFQHALHGSYVWSPKKGKNPAHNESHNNLTRMLPGDAVLLCDDAVVRAVGIVLSRAYEAPQPAEFSATADQRSKERGWRASVSFRELDTPLRPTDHAADLAAVAPKKHSPIRAGGRVNPSVYLAAVPDRMLEVLRRLLGSQIDRAERKIRESVGPELLDDMEEARIQQRTDIDLSTQQTLIRARRGQGRYRKDLEGVETGCRLTGLIDRRHLRASHVKPWCVCNDREKLDPANGLLLSPHIEHLFDRGYVSFTDDGDLLVSKSLNPVVLSAWALTSPFKKKPFSAGQRVYLDYHRTCVFDRHGRGKELER